MKRLLILGVCLAALQACKNDDPETGFQVAQGQGSENAGAQSVVIDLGHAVSAETVVSLVIGGDASLDGDYTATSSSKTYNSTAATFDLTAKAGASSVTLNFNIIDDTQIEPGKETIYFQIVSVAGSDITVDHATYIYEITDNDSPPASGMQVDLAWNIGEGMSINGVNFDLYLTHNVVITGSQVGQSEFIDTVQSAHPAGFENFILSTALPDEEYYLVFRYAEGTSDVQLFLTLSQGASIRPMQGVFSEDYAGKDIYYGPIFKSNGRFSSRGRSEAGDATTAAFSFDEARFFTGR